MPANVWSAFLSTSRRHPEKLAVISGSGSMTFRELHDRALRYTARFQALGLRRHDRVLLWMNASPEMASAMLGIWAAGGIAVLMDPSEPPSHLDHALHTVSPTIIVTPPQGALPHAVSVLTIASDAVRDDPARAVPSPSLPTDPASIVFTSGSTGRPKGVTQSHRNLVHACRVVGGYLGYTPQDRIVCTIPWSFDYGYGHLLSTAITGLTQIIPTKLNAFAICDAISEHQPTVLPIIPPIISYLLQGISPFRSIDRSSIRLVTNTGGTIPTTVLAQMLEALPDARVFLNFGLTESYRTSFLDPSLVHAKPTSIGKPIPGVDLILVRDDGTIVDGPDEPGQLVHRGDYLFMGYWNNPEATAKSLRPDPLAPANCPDPRPVLYTGDLATRDAEGYFYHAGRIDHQIKSMGVRVSPGEIEELVYASGLVREAGVFGLPHDMLGHEVWVALVPHESYSGADITGDLTSYARSAMSPYMIPRRFMVFTEPLPKTRTGKVDYPRLRQMAAQDQAATTHTIA